MDDIWLIILLWGGFIYFLGGIDYIITCWSDEDFLCRRYKDVTTKIGFIIFLMVDIVMLPWTLVCCLINSIILLFKQIIFGKDE